MSQSVFSWNDLIKKKATGIDDCDMGQIQEITTDIIVTKKGILDKKRYFLPKNIIVGFDRNMVYFRIVKAEAQNYVRESHLTV
jgi:hypothetical protein